MDAPVVRRWENMQTGKNGMLGVITLIGVMTLAGSAQASVTVTGQVNSTAADGEIVTLWLDANPNDNTTKAVQDANPYIDYYWFDDLTPMLDRNGYVVGAANIPVTIAMYCSGTKRDINGVLGSPYTNADRSVTVVHGTVDYLAIGGTYGMSLVELESCAVGEAFSKPLQAGWNLISLPLTPDDNSTGVVLSSMFGNYDAVYRYNATSKQFEVADVMNPGTGYFVHATADCRWEYSGTLYNSMDVSLEQGLNLVGWLNCSKDVSEALSSVSGNYYYTAQWNATAQRFEVYNPLAPAAFNDFARMDRGIGYFISAKEECTLSKNC